MYGTETVDLENALKSAKVNKERMMESYLNMKNKDRVSMAVSDLEHATVSGYHGAASDSVLEASPTWGKEMDQYFEAEEKAGGKKKKEKKKESQVRLSLWHGTEDHDVPIVAGDYLAKMLQPTVYHRIDNESHTLIRRNWCNILKEVVEYGQGSQYNDDDDDDDDKSDDDDQRVLVKEGGKL